MPGVKEDSREVPGRVRKNAQERKTAPPGDFYGLVTGTLMSWDKLASAMEAVNASASLAT